MHNKPINPDSKKVPLLRRATFCCRLWATLERKACLCWLCCLRQQQPSLKQQRFRLRFCRLGLSVSSQLESASASAGNERWFRLRFGNQAQWPVAPASPKPASAISVTGGLRSQPNHNTGRFALLGLLPVGFFVAHRSNLPLVPTPGTARHVSCGFRGRRGTAAR